MGNEKKNLYYFKKKFLRIFVEFYIYLVVKTVNVCYTGWEWEDKKTGIPF